MPRQLPPIEHRFPANRPHAPHTQKGPYLTCLLKRLIEKKIRYEDPETQKLIRGTVKDAIMWRYILNATQGETQAIEGILDRIDGKLGTNGNGKGNGNVIIQIIRPATDKNKNTDTSERVSIVRASVAGTGQGVSKTV